MQGRKAFNNSIIIVSSVKSTYNLVSCSEKHLNKKQLLAVSCFRLGNTRRLPHWAQGTRHRDEPRQTPNAKRQTPNQRGLALRFTCPCHCINTGRQARDCTATTIVAHKVLFLPGHLHNDVIPRKFNFPIQPLYLQLCSLHKVSIHLLIH